jgi:hypothetical protein
MVGSTAKSSTFERVPVFVREILTGGIAGAAAKTSVAPLERCKILYQTGRLHDSSVSSTLLSIKRQEGIRGLFKGNGASVLRIIPYASIHFGLYESYRRIFVDVWYGSGQWLGIGTPRGKLEPGQRISPIVDLLAGSGSGATAVMITYPLDFVRTRLAYSMEANSLLHRKSQTIRATLRDSLHKEGFLGLYRGIGPSMYGILPYAGLKFYVYQMLKQKYLVDGLQRGPHEETARLPVPHMLAFGGISGLIAQTATYPVDVVRRRMQIEGLQGGICEAMPRSTLSALLYIARKEGWGALWAGLSINYLKVVPSTAIGFTLYDYIKSKLQLSNNL